MSMKITNELEWHGGKEIPNPSTGSFLILTKNGGIAEALLAIVVIQREIRSLLTAFSEEHECFICDHQEVYDKISDVEQNIIHLNRMLRELKTKIIENYYDIQ